MYQLITTYDPTNFISLTSQNYKCLLQRRQIEFRSLRCNDERNSVIFVAFNYRLGYFRSLVLLYFNDEPAFNFLISLFLLSHLFSLLFEHIVLFFTHLWISKKVSLINEKVCFERTFKHKSFTVLE